MTSYYCARIVHCIWWLGNLTRKELYYINMKCRFLQNGCREHHLTQDSPLNFDLTLNAHVAEYVVRIAALDISNGGSYGIVSTGACLQAGDSTNRTSANRQKWVQSSEVSHMSRESNDVCDNHFTKPCTKFCFIGTKLCYDCICCEYCLHVKIDDGWRAESEQDGIWRT